MALTDDDVFALLDQQTGPASVAFVADFLHVTPPAVASALQRLERTGRVTIDKTMATYQNGRDVDGWCTWDLENRLLAGQKMRSEIAVERRDLAAALPNIDADSQVWARLLQLGDELDEMRTELEAAKNEIESLRDENRDLHADIERVEGALDG